MLIVFFLVICSVNSMNPSSLGEEEETLSEELMQLLQGHFEKSEHHKGKLSKLLTKVKEFLSMFSSGIVQNVEEMIKAESRIFEFLKDIYEKKKVTKSALRRWLSLLDTTFNLHRMESAGYGRYVYQMRSNNENIFKNKQLGGAIKDELYNVIVLKTEYFNSLLKVLQFLARHLRFTRDGQYLRCHSRLENLIAELLTPSEAAGQNIDVIKSGILPTPQSPVTREIPDPQEKKIPFSKDVKQLLSEPFTPEPPKEQMRIPVQVPLTPQQLQRDVTTPKTPRKKPGLKLKLPTETSESGVPTGEKPFGETPPKPPRKKPGLKLKLPTTVGDGGFTTGTSTKSPPKSPEKKEEEPTVIPQKKGGLAARRKTGLKLKVPTETGDKGFTMGAPTASPPKSPQKEEQKTVIPQKKGGLAARRQTALKLKMPTETGSSGFTTEQKSCPHQIT
ncbi:hypothetical protein EIN_400130 [Entamoeba invadens IP1]|uniref:Uncharacterized protein n=1 Tax=Entamoeba invadens IP1 TaxID=370355 RepID=A0A0A1UA70_ENTIV|nr:hypothetical protein EIN_400130 [Entamoeba invadens IP1]ELP91943.1 hypothetical protein EIN_400130 [Entamoeba invadens IP1]|eukprot:XP_004258714.1 hypothetical protein EIN_400130 [Entamoeba invadens IP1]